MDDARVIAGGAVNRNEAEFTASTRSGHGDAITHWENAMMNLHYSGRLALGMALTLCSMAWAAAPSSPNYVMQSSTLNAGGGDTVSVNYKLSSSLGDSPLSRVMISNGYRLRGGFGGFAGTTGFISQSDCLFNWAARNYPGFFSPAGAISNALAPYYYRYYSQTNAYLGTSSADSHVYYVGPVSNNSLLDIGALSGWLVAAGCQ